jgi:hypothetical protein
MSSNQLKIKLIGSHADIQAFLKVLNNLFDGRVLATRPIPNDQGEGYHVFCDVRISDLRRFRVEEVVRR